ncbi:hypothetical protein RDI58_017689 [Solanum bulbocastanum]|uniref:Uncharacterized protein n=1 Tax=Solanum bulbocastanum TaxID=147425 RepID=A0AAN8T9Z3_SOLBU
MYSSHGLLSVKTNIPQNQLSYFQIYYEASIMILNALTMFIIYYICLKAFTMFNLLLHSMISIMSSYDYVLRFHAIPRTWYIPSTNTYLCLHYFTNVRCDDSSPTVRDHYSL